MTDIEAQRHALQECWATYLRFVPLEFLPLLRSHCTQMQPHVKFKFELPTQNALAQVEAEIQRRADTKAQAEAPKFAVGDRVRILFDAHWRGQAYAATWEAADDPPLRDNLEGEDGFVSEVLPGEAPGERPRYGVRTCVNGAWDGGFYIFHECELEVYTPPTLRRLRRVRPKELVIGLRVRLALGGPLQGRTATVIGTGNHGDFSRVWAQVQLDEDFALGRVWSCYRIELEPLEAEEAANGQA